MYVQDMWGSGILVEEAEFRIPMESTVVVGMWVRRPAIYICFLYFAAIPSIPWANIQHPSCSRLQMRTNCFNLLICFHI